MFEFIVDVERAIVPTHGIGHTTSAKATRGRMHPKRDLLPRDFLDAFWGRCSLGSTTGGVVTGGLVSRPCVDWQHTVLSVGDKKVTLMLRIGRQDTAQRLTSWLQVRELGVESAGEGGKGWKASKLVGAGTWVHGRQDGMTPRPAGSSEWAETYVLHKLRALHLMSYAITLKLK